VPHTSLSLARFRRFRRFRDGAVLAAVSFSVSEWSCGISRSSLKRRGIVLWLRFMCREVNFVTWRFCGPQRPRNSLQRPKQALRLNNSTFLPPRLIQPFSTNLPSPSPSSILDTILQNYIFLPPPPSSHSGCQSSLASTASTVRACARRQRPNHRDPIQLALFMHERKFPLIYHH
jgi:hypothetical protein